MSSAFPIVVENDFVGSLFLSRDQSYLFLLFQVNNSHLFYLLVEKIFSIYDQSCFIFGLLDVVKELWRLIHKLFERSLSWYILDGLNSAAIEVSNAKMVGFFWIFFIVDAKIVDQGLISLHFNLNFFIAGSTNLVLCKTFLADDVSAL